MLHDCIQLLKKDKNGDYDCIVCHRRFRIVDLQLEQLPQVGV
jgi:hypothetical protein